MLSCRRAFRIASVTSTGAPSPIAAVPRLVLARRTFMGDDPAFSEWEKQVESKKEEDRQSKKRRAEKGHQEEKDWKKRPPYALHHDETREAKYRGHCHCEKVKYEVFDVPLDAHMCHCNTCQKIHGAPAHWSAIIKKEDVLFINGVKDLSFYRTSDHRTVHELPCKLSCAHCHSPIADEGRNTLLLYPSLINFESHEDREPFTPRRHVFYSMRAMDVHDGQEKYEGMQFESPLMDESEHGAPGIIGKGSRQDRDPNEKDGKHRSDNKRAREENGSK